MESKCLDFSKAIMERRIHSLPTADQLFCMKRFNKYKMFIELKFHNMNGTEKL